MYLVFRMDGFGLVRVRVYFYLVFRMDGLGLGYICI